MEFDLTQLDSSDDHCNLARAGHNVMPRLGDNSPIIVATISDKKSSLLSQKREESIPFLPLDNPIDTPR